MSNGSNNNQSWIVPITVAIITVIGAIAVPIIENFLAGNKSGETPVPPTSTPTPVPPTSTPTPVPPTSTPTPVPPTSTPTGCIITIRNPLVALHSEPNRFSREIIQVNPGKYSVLEHQIINQGVLGTESWFQIQTEGRKGWITDDTWTIEKKNSKCP